MDEPEIPIEERAARLQRQNDVQAGRIDTLMTKAMNEHRRAEAAESRATELEDALRAISDAEREHGDCFGETFDAVVAANALLSLPVPPKGPK